MPSRFYFVSLYLCSCYLIFLVLISFTLEGTNPLEDEPWLMLPQHGAMTPMCFWGYLQRGLYRKKGLCWTWVHHAVSNVCNSIKSTRRERMNISSHLSLLFVLNSVWLAASHSDHRKSSSVTVCLVNGMNR